MKTQGRIVSYTDTFYASSPHPRTKPSITVELMLWGGSVVTIPWNGPAPRLDDGVYVEIEVTQVKDEVS